MAARGASTAMLPISRNGWRRCRSSSSRAAWAGHRSSRGGAAGFFGSILPAEWSFQLALRSRGLGSACTTAALSQDAELKALLGIPDDVTPSAILPVAYTVGDDFKRARRAPVASVAYVDR